MPIFYCQTITPDAESSSISSSMSLAKSSLTPRKRVPNLKVITGTNNRDIVGSNLRRSQNRLRQHQAQVQSRSAESYRSNQRLPSEVATRLNIFAAARIKVLSDVAKKLSATPSQSERSKSASLGQTLWSPDTFTVVRWEAWRRLQASACQHLNANPYSQRVNKHPVFRIQPPLLILVPINTLNTLIRLLLIALWLKRLAITTQDIGKISLPYKH